MKLIILLSCIFVAAFIGQTYAEINAESYTGPSTYPPGYVELSTTTTITTTTPRSTTGTSSPASKEKPCGSNNLGDYKGGCDESVPVIVMPKGRPIMERVLDWFKCGTKSCLKSK